MKRFTRRPSPAFVIACIALFSSMGGVSYGLAAGSIDSREIKDGTIRNADFKNGTLRGQEAKPDGFGGGAIKESSLGVVPGASGVANSAVVAPTGAGVRGRNVTSAGRTGPGRYQVVFNQNVQACVYVATVGDEAAGGPGTGVASVSSLPDNGNGVLVRTSNASNGTPQDRGFHLIVNC